MKKQVVFKVTRKSPLYPVAVYHHKDSIFGADKPSPHPFNVHYNVKSMELFAKGIKKGDVVRCDGLPFQVRPKRILDRMNNKMYVPIKLESGLWVLRPKKVTFLATSKRGSMR